MKLKFNIMETKHLYFIFIPAILFALIGLGIRIIQYEPLYPKAAEVSEVIKPTTITLFSDDIISGNKQAKKTIIAFEDLGCAQCAVQSENIDELIKRYPDQVNVIWKLISVTTFPYSTELAHKYAYCANQQDKFDTFKKLAFANASNLSEGTLPLMAKEAELDQKQLATCLSNEKTDLYNQKTKALATSLNMQVVPTFFVDDVQIQSPQNIDAWVTALELE